MDKHNAVFVPIITQNASPSILLKEMCAGLEEEGVPYRIIDQKEELLTSLPISILVSGDQFMIFHEKLPEGQSYLNGCAGEERWGGKNAARLVKGLPLSNP
ncbi:glycerol dehydratase reactivase beta/small subunit family protein [Fictibacillus fluitans]|uniref:Glycerol dehydratase reactivase beta/small subunit family protein n=1 Tax=Fictibacillus fluitans TaxID=3058422 RepID=A0ABT8HQ97_9BACL|nr:glycerol dehydratase reactivase beta/small subunit family protein [Fictibacillus sp. NE201]MDN4522925.1 glycerol dehydratase reactivase beta/small subunit family protein [Fictibacillus sp. NE201]